MKTLRNVIKDVVDKHIPSSTEAYAATPLTAGNIIDDIIKALQEYKKTIEEVECMLLEFFPDAEVSIRSKVSETCELVYSIRKE